MNIGKSLITTVLAGISFVVFCVISLLFYNLYDLKRTVTSLQTAPQVQHASGGKQIIEKIVAKSEVWRPIQQQVKDTVVQVFAQISETDLLQPYKTPAQYSSTGSAFFINEQGDLLTNAHVVDQAKSLWIQIPSLGKRIIQVEVVGVSPERDIALIRVIPEDIKVIRNALGRIPYLPLGDSDLVFRSDEVLALGYPLGQQSVKSTTGVISGREHHYIQMSAPINPGNSGGPLVNINGEVVGINSAGVTEAQNIGYIIPINDAKIILPDLYKIKLLRKPFLGVLFNNASESLTEYLGNPQPGGCYVVEVVKNSTLYNAGVQRGDMIYEINGHRLDVYGEMNVPWSEDKISIIDYVSRLAIGEDVKLTIYRNGQRKELSVKFSQAELPSIHKIYPGYETVDYEIFGGMVVMQLTANHIQGMRKSIQGLARYAEMKNQKHPVLLITHIFPTSELFKTRSVTMGATLNEVNGEEVHTLQDLRKVLKDHASSKFLTLLVSDNLTMTTDNVFVVLPMDILVAQEQQLSRDYHYPITSTAQEILKKRGLAAQIQNVSL
ncbi:MAG: trypsin-like peptidase domain-containing protein [Candidatus Dependentiae bacterium]